MACSHHSAKNREVLLSEKHFVMYTLHIYISKLKVKHGAMEKLEAEQ